MLSYILEQLIHYYNLAKQKRRLTLAEEQLIEEFIRQKKEIQRIRRFP